MSITRGELHDRLNYHTMDADQRASSTAVRDAAKEFGETIIGSTPAGREQSLAITHLEEALMWANKAIAREGQ